jgi:hypothetical protein
LTSISSGTPCGCVGRADLPRVQRRLMSPGSVGLATGDRRYRSARLSCAASLACSPRAASRTAVVSSARCSLNRPVGTDSATRRSSARYGAPVRPHIRHP